MGVKFIGELIMGKNQCCSDKINECILEQMSNESELRSLAELYKIFGDVTRVKILKVLRIQEMCVCDLAMHVNMSQSAVSHQLRLLKAARLVRGRRDGKSIFYCLDDEHVEKILDMGIEHIHHK